MISGKKILSFKDSGNTWTKKNKLMNKAKMSKSRQRKGDPIVRQRLEDINKDKKIERFIENQREEISLKDKIELDFFV